MFEANNFFIGRRRHEVAIVIIVQCAVSPDLIDN